MQEYPTRPIVYTQHVYFDHLITQIAYTSIPYYHHAFYTERTGPSFMHWRNAGLVTRLSGRGPWPHRSCLRDVRGDIALLILLPSLGAQCLVLEGMNQELNRIGINKINNGTNPRVPAQTPR